MTVDPRFYRASAPVAVSELIDRYELQTDKVPDAFVSGISVFEDAGDGDLCFADDISLADSVVHKCADGVLCLTTREIGDRSGRPMGSLITVAPRISFFAIASEMFMPKFSFGEPDLSTIEVDATAMVHATAVIGEGVAIGPRTRVGPYACIDAGVQIGYDCQIGSSAQIGFSLIGNKVEIGSGARLGGSGFGLLPSAGGVQNTPHMGRLIVQDNVRIGSNTCIDRGVLGDTMIGESSKIDNLCHIGHNTRIGRNVVMAAFAGISGSVDIGDNVMMGGRVGIVDHVTIGSDAKLGADAAVFTSVPAGETWAGSPAKPLKQWQRETVWLKRQTRKREAD